MTDAELQADLDAITAITKRWQGHAHYAFVVLPKHDERFIVQANIGEADVVTLLRDAADDVADSEGTTEIPIGTSTQ